MGHGVTPFLAALLIGTAACVGAAPGAEEPLPDHRLGLRTAPLLLLSRPDVRADLGLVPKQAADAERMITDLFVKAVALRGKNGPDVVAARREIDVTMQTWLETHLSEAQFQRLSEVDLQWEGPSALISRPVVADHLGLTTEQRNALGLAVDERNRRRARHGLQTGVEVQLARNALAVLSPAQRNRWKAMLGRPFVPQLAGAQANPPR
jgi:hypothetical protein